MSYKGKEYCILDDDHKNTRTIWFKDAFKDQDFYTSEVAMEFKMKNPENNHAGDDAVATAGMSPAEKDEYTRRQSFHIHTYDFDIDADFKNLKAAPAFKGYTPVPASSVAPSNPGSRKAFNDAVTGVKAKGTSPATYAIPIDELLGDAVRPKLACNAPCYTCLSSQPDYCQSCWGPGAGAAPYPNTFLVSTAEGSTCAAQCPDGYTTNGNKVVGKDDTGAIVPSKTYQVCTNCDLACRTCKGQTLKPAGVKGDKSKCLTCSSTFPYIVKAQETCFTACTSGFYEVLQPKYDRNGRTTGRQRVPGMEECKACEAPCASCRDTASFCLSCVQGAFFAEEWDDLEDVVRYAANQAGMNAGKAVQLTTA